MIVRLIAETLTPIVTRSRSRFFKIDGARGVVSNRPHLEQEAPVRHRCRTMVIVKQGAHGFPVHFRAHAGYLHLDLKAHTGKQARRKLKRFLRLQFVGEFTTWGYGRIRWVRQQNYYTPKPAHAWGPRFRILKGLPPNLTPQEQQLVMAALLHDLVDTATHPSKLGRSITIRNPYVQWLCVQHHAAKDHPDISDLQFLQEADSRTARYARLLEIPTRRRKLAPVDTRPLALQLEQATHRSVYSLYSVVYHSEELNSLTASKARPTETLRNHLIGVANWVLFLLRTQSVI